MIPECDYHSVTAWLEESRRPLLVSHRRPDGDGLGALAAMALALRHLGGEPAVVLFEPFPSRYDVIKAATTWYQWDETRDVLAAECDAVVVLDTCSRMQLEPLVDYLVRGPRTLVIDHHATRDSIGTRPADLRLFDDSASATCLLVAEWVRAAGVPLDELLATALQIGLATDTGWFRFSNTDPRTLRVAAELLEAGAQFHTLYRALYQQDHPAKLRLIARVLTGLELEADGRLAVMKLRPADLEATGADLTMTEELANEAGRLGCIEATLLFTEEPDGEIRVNFRSKRALDVSQLATRFGGGGHARAAGARVRGEWDVTVPRVIAETIEALQASE
ncbi:MAG: DHH family phosphoesterase [Planctomycetes bacterium]|nr:DHH family phosphoesterase [Planctomycetota bacterium]